MYLGEFPSWYLELGWSYHKIFCCQLGFSDLLVGCFFVDVFSSLIFFGNLWILNIIWFSPTIHHWIGAFDFTQILRNAHFVEELILYWPSKIFFPFRQSIPMGEKFRRFKGIWCHALVSFLSIFLPCSFIHAHYFAWLLNSSYKPS